MRHLRSGVVGLSIALIFASLIATAQDDNEAMGNIGARSKVVVGKKSIIIPANEDVVYFQNGVLTSFQDMDKDSPNCRLHVVSKPVVRSLGPGREFIVTGAGYGNGSTAWDNVLYFRNDATVDQLQCSVGRHGTGDMTIQELKLQLGDLFRLILAPPAKG